LFVHLVISLTSIIVLRFSALHRIILNNQFLQIVRQWGKTSPKDLTCFLVLHSGSGSLSYSDLQLHSSLSISTKMRRCSIVLKQASVSLHLQTLLLWLWATCIDLICPAESALVITYQKMLARKLKTNIWWYKAYSLK